MDGARDISDQKDWKYEVPTQKTDKVQKIPNEVLSKVKGVKGKIFNQIKKE
ncbi:MAG: hypothetical protein ACUVQ8_03080 [Nitrososphaeria archaeon]